MGQRLRACLVVAVAAGVLGVGGGPVFAGAGARGGVAGSPGAPSGSVVLAEALAPVAACGNPLGGVRALLGPASGIRCGNGARSSRSPLAGRRAEGRRERRPVGVSEGAVRRGLGVRGYRDPRVGAVARAGKSVGEALLASSGARRLGLVAGVGGGLVLGGVALLHRVRGRRG
ncbi:chaplin family protein [Streptomyces lunalinharesii]|uniref:Chaplin domain-containing protein n=1 Tax=Streptomyces lunalinharesii TaxID=333384 RepID=A0ABN3SGQ9_9ACTN